MPFAEHFMLQGTVTAPGTLPGSLNINLGFLPTKVELINRTEIGDASANEVWERVTWNADFGSANNYVEWHTASSTAMNVSNVTANGISLYDGLQSVLLGTLQSGTIITKANPAVVTATAHGLQTGDVILMSQNAVMTQLGGLSFVVTVTTANAFTIPINTNTAAFTQESSFKFRKIIVGALYYPTRHTISNITQANPMVISTLTNHGLTVGQQVRIRVPVVFGMKEANNLQGIISAVTPTTMTFGGPYKSIDSTNFTAWAWPATTKVPFTPAIIVPEGSGPTPFTFGNITYDVDVLDDATVNNQFQGFTIGTGLLQTATGAVIGVVASDVISWTAWRGDL